MRIHVAQPNEERKISYGTHKTPFGTCFIAVTEKGICTMAFVHKKEDDTRLSKLKRQWKRAVFSHNHSKTKKYIDTIFGKGHHKIDFDIHIPGTDFQVAVWRTLLNIPRGQTVSYKTIAEKIGSPRAVRAVGMAVGANPIAYIIPCHRVIRYDGIIGNYRWGIERKKAILDQEAIDAR